MHSPDRPWRILVINHHGDNRGDEAALRGLVEGLNRQLGDLELVVVHQYSDPASEVDLGVSTTYVPMIMGVVGYAALLVHALLLVIGVDATRALVGGPRRIAAAYPGADVVVSAPGGPYFGDLYAGHEVAHWLLVWIARLHGLRTVLYAPSVGPFELRVLAPLRRAGFRLFDEIAVREDRSRALLEAFTGGEIVPLVTADSALQQRLPSPPPGVDGSELLRLVVAARDAGHRNPQYDEAIVAAIEAVCVEQPTEVMFVPQLHGPRHRDADYLAGLGNRIRHARSVVVLDEDEVSDVHRAAIATADVVVAGRYHPAVFAVAASTPALVIPYEHKMHGLAEEAGLLEWTIDTSDVTVEGLTQRLQDLVSARDKVRAHLKTVAPDLVDRAEGTSRMVARVLDAAPSVGSGR